MAQTASLNHRPQTVTKSAPSPPRCLCEYILPTSWGAEQAVLPEPNFIFVALLNHDWVLQCNELTVNTELRYTRKNLP